MDEETSSYDPNYDWSQWDAAADEYVNSYVPPLDTVNGGDGGGTTTYYGTGELTEAEKAELAKQTSPSLKQFMSDAVTKLGDSAGAFLKNYLYDPKTGKLNLAGIATGITALSALTEIGRAHV